MDNILRHFRNAAGKIGRYLNDAADVFDSEDPLIILPYRGYANENRIFLKGRILENENIFQGKSDSEIRNLIDSWKRFETDEVAKAEVGVTINQENFVLQTDEEGYFTLDSNWKGFDEKLRNSWMPVQLSLLETPNNPTPTVTTQGEVYIPSKNADYGVITDVDDTVLQTHVTSLFRLKMLYATFLQDAHQRLPMEGMVELFQAFEKGGNGQRENPIFYVSNSPWNLYDLLEEFFSLRKFPKGPILLRDYGVNPAGDFSGHKMKTISHIMETYSDLPFILLGDTASKDADFYIELARKFPNRIRAIYIRHTKDTKNARRVATLIEQTTNVEVFMVKQSSEILRHAMDSALLHKMEEGTTKV